MKLTFTWMACLLISSGYAQQLPKMKPTIPVVKNKQQEMYESFKAKADKDEVWFFEHAAYGGKKYVLTRGQYTLKELGMDANDFFSSAIIPDNLKVLVFEDDKLSGTYYYLLPDNNAKKYNADFTKVEIMRGKDVDGRTLEGTKDLNDKISSILIFDAYVDVVTLYKDCNYVGESVVLPPFAINKVDQVKCFSATPVTKKWGWLNLADIGFDDVTSSIKLQGKIAEVRMFTGKNLEVSGNNSKVNAIRGSTPCLKNKEFTTDNAVYPGNSDWNDRVTSVTISMLPGSVTIVN